MNKAHQKGFTLLEIMVTVAIVGILAAIAIPIYNNYITKTRIADALTHGRVYAGKVTIDKEDVVEAPSGLEYSKIKLAGSQKKPRVRIKLKKTIDSTVLMDPDDRAGGKVIVLSEESSDASVQWVCTTNLPQALIPEGCTYEEGVGQRKLLAEWTEGKGEACWSPERTARGKSGWAVGSCTSCNQKGTQRRAEKGKKPGAAKMHGTKCSGQYFDEETLAKIEVAEAEAAKVEAAEAEAAKVEAAEAEAAKVEAARVAEEAEEAEEARVAEEAEAARVAEEAEAARVAGLPPGEAEREEAWDRLIESGESTDGTPWAEVPAKAQEDDNVTACWDQKVSQVSLAADGDGSGWVAGPHAPAPQRGTSRTMRGVRYAGRDLANGFPLSAAYLGTTALRRTFAAAVYNSDVRPMGFVCVPK
jgi:prepilin-type N-terminal cleavage/methylation domain-containing protein